MPVPFFSGAGEAADVAKAAKDAKSALKSAEEATKTVEKTASGKRVGDFTKSQKDKAKAENAVTNGGTMACQDCDKALQSIKNEKGIPTPSNQAQVHHDPPICEGGGRHSTPVVVCPTCHQVRHANE